MRDPDLVAALRECPAVDLPGPLRAVIHAPDDAAPRRELAAALRVRGEDWAELIDLQLQTAELSEVDLDRNRDTLRRQARILRRRRGLHAAVAGTVGTRGALSLRRGLVEHARLPAATLLRWRAELFALTPLRGLALFPVTGEQLGELGRSEEASRLRLLSLAGPAIDDAALDALLESPVPDRLESLTLDDAPITDRTLERLAAALSLHRLVLGGGRHTSRGLAALARAPSLRELAIEGRWLDDEALDELTRLGGVGLETLHVIHGRLGPSLRRLAVSSVVAPLRRLALTRSVEDPGPVVDLMGGLRRLEALHVDGCPLGREGAETIAAARYAPGLAKLTLYRVGLDGQAVSVLAGARLPSLGWLDLTLNDMGDAGAAALGRASFAPDLTRLSLAETGIGPTGVAALVQNMSSLVVLDLSGNRIGDEGAQALAAAPALSRVELLRLSSCGIGPEGARAILNSPHLQGAARIALGGESIGAEAQAELDARRARLDPFLAV